MNALIFLVLNIWVFLRLILCHLFRGVVGAAQLSQVEELTSQGWPFHIPTHPPHHIHANMSYSLIMCREVLISKLSILKEMYYLIHPKGWIIDANTAENCPESRCVELFISSDLKISLDPQDVPQEISWSSGM